MTNDKDDSVIAFGILEVNNQTMSACGGVLLNRKVKVPF